MGKPKILIDTSAWAAYFSQDPCELGDQVAAAIEQDRAVICGIIIAELLQSALDSKTQKQLDVLFKHVKSLPMPESAMLKAGIKLQALHSKGLTVSLNTALIAEIAIEHNIRLLSASKQFEHLEVNQA